MNQGGLGVMVRNEYGKCVAAFARHIPHASSAVQMEAEACRSGILIAVHQGWQDVDFECDCSMMITALASTSLDFSEVGRIVEDCLEYMSECSSFHIKHVYSEANGVAHRLTHFASLFDLDEFWLDETPFIIEDVLYEDYCSSTRGPCSLSRSVYNHIIH